VSNDGLGDYPEKQLPDRVHAVARAGAGSVPLVGAAAQVLLEEVLPSAIERRRDAWFRRLGGLVDDLNDRLEDFDPASLADNDLFLSATFEASRIAMGTHLEAKLDLLKNCLARLVLPNEMDDFVALRFLGFVDELSPEHFVVLAYAADPPGWFEAKQLQRPNITGGARRAIADAACLPAEGDVLAIVLRDLGQHGLATPESLSGMVSEQGLWDAWATDLGRLLLGFVEEF
jgi:hypothetical protein